MIHVRKVHPEYYEDLRTGRKRFELRKEDEGEESFAVGDFLALNEWEPGEAARFYSEGRLVTEIGDGGRYTGRCLLFEILYILRGHELQQPGTAILSLSLRPLCADDVAGIRPR